MKKNIKKIMVLLLFLNITFFSYANPLWDMSDAIYFDTVPLDSWIVTRRSIKNINLKENETIVTNSEDVVPFGKWWKEVDTSNLTSYMLWDILDKNNGTALLISRATIEFKQYDDENINTNWEDSSLRKWLNNDFYNYVFSDTDKEYIVNYEETGDMVFILSKDEIENYFPEKHLFIKKSIGGGKDIDKYTFCVPFALTSLENVSENIVEVDESTKDYYSYWIRGNFQDLNVCTASRDYVNANCTKYCGVRPVIKVKYDTNADGTFRRTIDSWTFGFYDTLRDDFLPGIVNKGLDFLEKIVDRKKD